MSFVKEPSEYTQLVALAKEHTAQIERITKDCTDAVSRLDRSRIAFEKIKGWQEWARIFVPLLIVIFILLGAAFIPCGYHGTFAGTEISRSCVPENNAKNTK